MVYLSKEESPENLTLQLYEILLKSARRCAYDLGHAVDMIDGTRESELKDILRNSAEHWKDLFTAGNAMKDYRLSYVHDIFDLEQDVKRAETELTRLITLLEEAGIDHKSWYESAKIFGDYI